MSLAETLQKWVLGFCSSLLTEYIFKAEPFHLRWLEKLKKFKHATFSDMNLGICPKVALREWSFHFYKNCALFDYSLELCQCMNKSPFNCKHRLPGGSDGKESTYNAGDPGSIPGEENGYPSSILAWRIPWTEKPGWLQHMGSERVGHNWANNICTFSL